MGIINKMSEVQRTWYKLIHYWNANISSKEWKRNYSIRRKLLQRLETHPSYTEFGLKNRHLPNDGPEENLGSTDHILQENLHEPLLLSSKGLFYGTHPPDFYRRNFKTSVFSSRLSTSTWFWKEMHWQTIAALAVSLQIITKRITYWTDISFEIDEDHSIHAAIMQRPFELLGYAHALWLASFLNRRCSEHFGAGYGKEKKRIIITSCMDCMIP